MQKWEQNWCGETFGWDKKWTSIGRVVFWYLKVQCGVSLYKVQTLGLHSVTSRGWWDAVLSEHYPPVASQTPGLVRMEKNKPWFICLVWLWGVLFTLQTLLCNENLGWCSLFSSSPLARLLFPPVDDNVLRFLYDDNQRVEPEWYMPIIPMVLINGAEGIGTGWSCKIPNFDIRETVNNIRCLLDGKEPLPMVNNGFKKQCLVCWFIQHMLKHMMLFCVCACNPVVFFLLSFPATRTSKAQ